MMGQIILVKSFENNNGVLELSDLIEGVYFLKLENKNGSYETYKIKKITSHNSRLA